MDCRHNWKGNGFSRISINKHIVERYCRPSFDIRAKLVAVRNLEIQPNLQNQKSCQSFMYTWTQRLPFTSFPKKSNPKSQIIDQLSRWKDLWKCFLIALYSFFKTCLVLEVARYFHQSYHAVNAVRHLEYHGCRYAIQNQQQLEVTQNIDNIFIFESTCLKKQSSLRTLTFNVNIERPFKCFPITFVFLLKNVNFSCDAMSWNYSLHKLRRWQMPWYFVWKYLKNQTSFEEIAVRGNYTSLDRSFQQNNDFFCYFLFTLYHFTYPNLHQMNDIYSEARRRDVSSMTTNIDNQPL